MTIAGLTNCTRLSDRASVCLNFNTSDRMIQNCYLTDTTEHSYRSAAGLYQSFFDFLHLVHQDPTFTDYPVIISDWNNTYHQRLCPDTCFMSSFIAYTVQMLIGTQVQMLGFRSLCDVNEDFPENRLFGGGPRSAGYPRIEKAIYILVQLESVE